MSLSSTDEQAPFYERPDELLQRLIRFETTNPPGNERECVEWIDGVLRDGGYETKILAKDPERPNLLARLKGRDEAQSLLLYGHIDVVPVEGQNWQHPPFEGKNVNGWVWGRGALDMKGGVAMMLATFSRAKAEGLTPPGDVLFLVLSDEESGGDYGAKYLVEEHARLFDGVRYALGEFGGFPLYVGRRRFYPIQVAEKQLCFLRAVVGDRAVTARCPCAVGPWPSWHDSSSGWTGAACRCTSRPWHVALSRRWPPPQRSRPAPSSAGSSTPA